MPDTIVTADDVSRGKPEPEGYITLARSLGRDPARCVVIEDAPAGVEAGQAAGAPVIALTTTHDPARLSTATMIIPDLRDLNVAKQPHSIALPIIGS